MDSYGNMAYVTSTGVTGDSVNSGGIEMVNLTTHAVTTLLNDIQKTDLLTDIVVINSTKAFVVYSENTISKIHPVTMTAAAAEIGPALYFVENGSGGIGSFQTVLMEVEIYKVIPLDTTGLNQ